MQVQTKPSLINVTPNTEVNGKMNEERKGSQQRSTLHKTLLSCVCHVKECQESYHARLKMATNWDILPSYLHCIETSASLNTSLKLSHLIQQVSLQYHYLLLCCGLVMLVPQCESQQTLTCKLCLRFHGQAALDSWYLGHLSAEQQTHIDVQ